MPNRAKESPFRCPGPAARRDSLIVILAALAVHAALLATDFATRFQAFAWGDRGEGRVKFLADFASRHHPDWLQAMLRAEIGPGEYILVLIPFKMGGPAGVVLLQVVLLLLSAAAVARMARWLVPGRAAPALCGIAYVLLPQNLVYPHQLVTEAIATPFCVFWLYFLYRGFREGGSRDFLLAGGCLGLAIFARPATAMVLPALYLILFLARRTRPLLARRALHLGAAAAMAPLLAWAAIFTNHTGHFGYENGIANLSWNLWSKARIVQEANGIPPSPALAGDEQLSVGEFLGLAAKHPVPFAKAAMLDAAVVFFRGNTTKFTIDYLGIGRENKNWRQQILYNKQSGGAAGRLLRPEFLIEGAASLIMALASLITIGFTARILWAKPRGLPDDRPADRHGFAAITMALLVMVLASAQMVDQSQGRLRNPAEAAMLLTVACAWAQWRSRRPASGKAAA